MRLVALALVVAVAVGCGTKPHPRLSPRQAAIFRGVRARHARLRIANAAGVVVVAIGVGKDFGRATDAYLGAVRAGEPYLPLGTLVHDPSFGTASVARSVRPFCARCAARIDALTRSITSRA